MTRSALLLALALSCGRADRPIHRQALADLQGASDRLDDLEVRLHAGGRAVARAQGAAFTDRLARMHRQGTRRGMK